MDDDARDRRSADDGTMPLRFEPIPVLDDPEPAVAAALEVIERSLTDMAARATRPLLDPPTQPFRLRPVGAGGPAVFPVVLDTAGLADAPDRVGAHRVLDAHAAMGGNALVVADAPDGGPVELTGTWLANRKRHGTTVLLGTAGEAGLGAPELAAAVRRLLARTGAERLDVLIVDGPAGGTSLEETLTALAGLVEQQVVGAIAAGARTTERLIQARVLTGQRGLPAFTAVAPVYDLLERGYERELAAVVHAQGLACLPVPSRAGRLLPGAGRSRLRRVLESRDDGARRIGRTADAIARIAAARELPAIAVALAWLLTRPHVVAPIVAASSVEQVWAAGAAAALHLTRAEAVALERASDPRER